MSITLTFEVDTPEEASEILALVGRGNSVLRPDHTAASSPVDDLPPAPAVVPTASTTTLSPAVAKALTDNGLSADDITGTGKEGRITKADVTAYVKTNTPPEPEEVDPFSLDPEEPAQTPEATKEDVRMALITYQTKLRDSLIASGTAEDEAKTSAMDKARGLLSEVGGVATLGGLKEAQYGSVVTQAQAAANAL